MEATTTLDRRVRVIPATKTQGAIHSTHDGKKRVAAYCRVNDPTQFEQVDETCGLGRVALCSNALA